MSTLKKFAGQTLIYGLSTIIARLLNFVLTPIYVKVYHPTVFGILTNLYSWAAILNAILAFGMETTFFRYLQKHEDNKKQVINTTFFFVLLTSSVFLICTLLFAKDISGWLFCEKGAERVIYVYFFAIILTMDALAVIPFALIRAREKPLRYGLIKLANILIMIGFTLLFIVILPYIVKNNLPGAEWISQWLKLQKVIGGQAEDLTPVAWIGYVFLANLIASVATLLLLIPELSQLKIQANKKLMKEMLWYSLPILIANLSFIINENLDKIFLTKLLPLEIGERDLGIYGACAKIAMFLSIFIQAFRLGAEPFFFSHAKNPNARSTYAIIMNYFIIAICLAVVALVANTEILKYFIKGKNLEQQALYWSGLGVVPVLLMGYIFLGIYMNLSIWYKLSDQTKYGLYISGIGAIITIVLNIIFIPKYSYIASAWITMFAYFVMMLLSYFLGQKNYPIPYHIKKNICYIGAAALISWMSFYLFDRNLIVGNALFFIFIGITVLAEKKQLTELIVKKDDY